MQNHSAECTSQFRVRPETVWRLAGYLDSEQGKYFDPVLFSRELGRRWWIVLREQSGSGIGYHRTTQRWFEVNQPRLVEVGSFLDSGYLNWGRGELVARSAAYVVGFERRERGDVFRVRNALDFAIVNFDGVDVGFLGSVSRTAIYRREFVAGFHLDPRGGLTEQAIEQRFLTRPSPLLDASLSLLRNNVSNLLTIARGPSMPERRWLAQNVHAFPPGPERERILDARHRARATHG